MMRSVRENNGLIFVRRYLSHGLFFCVLTITPTTVLGLNFKEAYDKLLENNLSYLRAKLDVKADKELIKQSRANLLPNISARGSAGYIKNNAENFDGSALDGSSDPDEQRRRGREEYALSLKQPIYNRSISTRVKQSKSKVFESELRLQRILEKQILSLSEAYIGYQQSIVNMDISKQELQSVNAHRLLTAQRQEIGIGTMADVYEAISRYKTAQVELLEDIKAKESFAGRLGRLIQVEDLVFGKNLLNYNEIQRELGTQSVNELIQENLESNVEVGLQRQVVASTKVAIKLDKANRLPTVDLVASKSRTIMDAFEGSDEQVSKDERVMLEVNIPLFSGFGKNSKIREARYRYQAEKIELENTIATQKEAIREAYYSKQTSYEKMISLEESYQNLSKALSLRKEGYLEGIVSSLEVLNAYRDKHRAEKSWNESCFEYLADTIRLNIALGKVSRQDIGDVDKFFMSISHDDH